MVVLSNPYPMIYLAIMLTSEPIQYTWEALLSRQPEQVLSAYQHATPAEQAAILIHLQRMTSEDGWQPEQKLSAQIALQVITQAQTD